MIRNEYLREFIKLLILSAYIKDEISVSGLVVAKPESGKTKALFEYRLNNGVIMTSDIVKTGLENLLEEFENDRAKTLLIPDMLKVFGRKLDTSKNFITFLNEFIEEGIVSLDLFDKKVKFDNPVRGNIISAITSTDFFDNVVYWGSIGFLSRVIPFSYDYTEKDVLNIFEDIFVGQKNDTFLKLKFYKPKNIFISREFCLELKNNVTEHLILEFKKMTKETIRGFRIQRNIQVLTKASAYEDKRKNVNKSDIDRVIKLSKHFNYKLNPIMCEQNVNQPTSVL